MGRSLLSDEFFAFFVPFRAYSSSSLQVLPGHRRFPVGRRNDDSASGTGIWLIGDNPVLCLRNRVGYSISNLIQSERLRLSPRL